MEQGVRKSSTCNLAEKEKSPSSNDGNSSKRDTAKHLKEVNSWDRSTPTSNGEAPKGKANDWDSSSECQETMVVPFDNAENPKEDENWDSESEKNGSKSEVAGGKGAQPFCLGSLDSLNLSFTDVEKSFQDDDEAHQEDSLLVEDFEEFLKDEEEELPPSRGTSDLGADSEKVRSNESEGTPEDTTIWMIPKTERTQSRESTSKLISSSDREKLEKLEKFKSFLKKTKSLSDVQKNKIKRRTARSSRSEYLGCQKNNYNSFLICEGSDLKRKLEIESEKPKESISGCESFDRTRVFFTEYECRTMTMDTDAPGKLCTPSTTTFVNVPEETVPEEDVDSPVESNNSENRIERKTNATSEAAINEMGRPGPSGLVSMDVLSLPDMIGKKSKKERKPENDARENLEEKEKSPNAKKSDTSSTDDSQLSESWVLLDETGQYQAIPRNVVSILLNGRSAEAVLQGRKEHFIPNLSLRDTASLKESFSSRMVQESWQHILKEEDTGGEDDRKRIIDLERKVENTLFYIQPGMNHTASVRIIPLDTEMIHVWRRTRDGGSMQSLDTDGMNSSQHSVEIMNHRAPIDLHSSITRRPFAEETVSEEDETQPPDPPTVNRPLGSALSEHHENEMAEYSKMLIETRLIVDTLTTNFKILQNRLDGETNQSRILQGEVNKLYALLKNYEGKFQDKYSRETVSDAMSEQSNVTTIPSFLIIKENTDLKSESIIAERFEETDSKSILEVMDKSTNTEVMPSPMNQIVEEPKGIGVNEGGEIVTVNIYTMESFLPEFTYDKHQDHPIVQPNLESIEQRMRSLQEENQMVLRQNVELKRKLKEISLELEKYLAGRDHHDMCGEENRELETLRDQVCNLKLELENLKTAVRVQKNKFTEENSAMREEYKKSLSLLKNWSTVAAEILKKIETTTNELQENEIPVDVNLDFSSAEDPESFSNCLTSYSEQTAQCLIKMKNENFLLEETLKKDLGKGSNAEKEISSLDQVISGYAELIEQCKKGQLTGETESKVMEDYFTVIMEKASLMEEIKILKTENEMLLEGQLEHYEKLKQTMIALKERKSEITVLESSQKLLEEERSRMTEVLKLCEEEKNAMEAEVLEKSKAIQDFIEELKRRDFEMADCKERLKAAVKEIENFEKSCRLKDELINELKMENDELLNADGAKNEQIEILKDEIKNLEMQGTHLEAELNSSKLFLNESRKEMTDYITHLETLVNNLQDSLDKQKQKLKESNQTISRLKSENDIMDKQHQCDVKLFNNTKDELDSCKEKLAKIEKKLKELEEDREKLQGKCDTLSSSEKEKSEALELLSGQYKTILGENADLAEKVQILSKDKDESLKEQKDLINKYAILSKEIQKLQDKYRNVKSECNERTDLIKYLEMLLRENLVEYNNRIACLEQNISRIIEKIVACKDGMKEKHFGVDAEVRELRHQLDVTHKERKEMENVVNDYYSLTKHLEREIQDREKKVDELHAQLSIEQRKAVEYENERSCHALEAAISADCLKIEQLESQIAITDSELAECKKELQRRQSNYDNEKKRLELTIADLKSEVQRYQFRIEVMMKNLSNCNKNLNGVITDKREDTELQTIKKELQEKNKTITELKDTIDKYKAEIKLKKSDLDKKDSHREEELKNLQNQIDRMQYVMSTANKASAAQQKERDEMAEKLFQSIKLIMEERSARQSIESLLVEKEKNFQNQIDHLKNELALKVKECESVSEALEEKKKIANKLQDDLKKMKAEVSSLRLQLNNYKKRTFHKGNGDGITEEEQLSHISNSLTQSRPQSVSQERLESCLRELKEIRDVNLELRKTEGQYQAKIVRLEDEIRDARLLIKELQGDIKTEKKSKKAFKNMIMAAKMEIEKCVLAKQLMSVIAERISRHLELSEIPSREFLSGFRLSDSSNSSKYLQE